MRMLKVQITVIAVMMVSAMITSTAFAEELLPLWLVNANPVPAGGATVDIEVGSSLLLLEDMEAGPLKLATDVECSGAGLGLLLPEGLDEQDSTTLNECMLKTAGSCETLQAAELVDLPWLSKLLEPTEGEFVDDTFEPLGGVAGWLMECETALGKRDDTCTPNNHGAMLVTNEASGEVGAEFAEAGAGANQASCTEGNESSGLIVGLLLLHVLETGVLVPLSAS